MFEVIHGSEMDPWLDLGVGLGVGVGGSLNMDGAGIEGCQIKLEDRWDKADLYGIGFNFSACSFPGIFNLCNEVNGQWKFAQFYGKLTIKELKGNKIYLLREFLKIIHNTEGQIE